MVYRIYSEKKSAYAVEAKSVLADICDNLQISSLKSVRVINRYDVEGIEESDFARAINTVFSEPQIDTAFTEPDFLSEKFVFAVEYLPGQFDQRADSAAQCIELLTMKERPLTRSAKVYVFSGNLSDGEFEAIKNYLVNPVEARIASLEIPKTLVMETEAPPDVPLVDGFTDLLRYSDKYFLEKFGLAMDLADVRFCREYFKSQNRNPTETELKILDTYWSDHCRHTTFGTIIAKADIEPDYIKKTFENYCELREKIYAGRDKDLTLMDIATIGAKELKSRGLLQNLDESEEINACSIKVTVNDGKKDIPYLLMFKNETHNHPTEREPFGGAATCLGGAIRDPLSGRSYVYQAMRVTGAADPRVPVSETLPHKLPQKKIVQTAAAGYSSYGNQIGLATGFVNEIYHKNYVAKRLEIGAVLGAAPLENVRRERPCAGDVVVLLGGATGRDGCGGATGSSKSHTADSLESCGAEVQKGNAPEERKLQRLFRNKAATSLIKRCNDFGAGGVSVAIGELADGLCINLDAIPKKYEGLSGTELAISESQERMAVVVAKEDCEKFIKLAAAENLNACKVAEVTEEKRMKMIWRGETIADLDREFLNSNGAKRSMKALVKSVDLSGIYDGFSPSGDLKSRLTAVISDLNVCSQKGLVERFDGSIGAGSVTMPFGGKYQETPIQTMIAKLPVLGGQTDFCSAMAYGFNPFISEKSPFHGAVLAIVESVAKLVAAGASHRSAYLTLQEYFERTNNKAERWGKPFAALLGALYAQLGLEIAAIGGKDSMSGSFEHIDVPPTLVSFAVGTLDAKNAVTPEFKKAGSDVYLFELEYDENKLPVFESLHKIYDKINKLIESGKVYSASAVTAGGIAEAAVKAAFGNKIGFEFAKDADLFSLCYGGIIVETDEVLPAKLIGITNESGKISKGTESVEIDLLLAAWHKPLEPIFKTRADAAGEATPLSYETRNAKAPAIKAAKPRVVLPVFPGTNCEYDSAAAFEKAGAETEFCIIKNLTPEALSESVAAFEKAIKNSNILMLSGGFSGGDEPEGSAKFIAAILKNERIKEAVTELLEKRDGLMLGICNGFQALIKLGLVPFGKFTEMTDKCPTLTFNNIGRHQSMLVTTRVSSVLSPWLAGCEVGDLHKIAISHGEGKFVASEDVLASLIKNGQIATQYTDLDGNPTMKIPFNPNGSLFAIEGITSPDGRILGKMGHSERVGNFVHKNIPGEKDQKIFDSGVKYFK